MADSFTYVPETISCYRVPRAVLLATAEALRHESAGVRESVALWQGRVLSESIAEVTKLHVPRQIAGPLHFNVPLDERLRLVRAVSSEDEFILIQLHTHPRRAFHSDVDDRLAITKHTGAISIVVADFGTRWNGDLLQSSVNRNLGGGRWVELSPNEVAQLFEVTDSYGGIRQQTICETHRRSSGCFRSSGGDA